MPNKSFLAKIHIAKKELKLSDENYRQILSGFINNKGEPCTSSKELNDKQSEVLLDSFKKLGWIAKKSGKQLKYEEFNNRDKKFASPAQMRKIESLWMQHSREKTEQSMNHFIKRIANADHITFLLKKDVQRILKAIESLKPAEGKSE